MANDTRSVPYNVEAEIYVIGSTFIDPNIISGLVSKLIPEDFYDPNTRSLYKAIIELYKRQEKIDPLTVMDSLKHLGLDLTVDAKTYILNAIDTVPSTSTTNLYIDMIKDRAVERELLSNMRELSDHILSGDLPFNALLDQAEDKVQGIIKKRRTSEFMTIERAAKEVFEHIEQFTNRKSAVTGINTGFPRLNRATLGFQKGELTILAARPSVGKSALALQLACNMCESANAHVAFFSLEMSIDQLMMRLYSYKTYIPLTKIRSGDLDPKEIINLAQAKQALMKNHIYFDESNSSNIYDIRNKCRDLKRKDQLDIIIIDYLQLVSGSTKGSRQEEVSDISRNLKTLAKELDVPVIALSQLSRLVETREDKRPVLSDLRESGSIEQDADIVMFLSRIDASKKKALETAEIVPADEAQDDNGKRSLELIIAKNRQGALVDIPYTFFAGECRFQESRFMRKTKPIKNEDESESE